MSIYASCALCPRKCGVNRAAGERGFCGETSELRLAAASLHRGEEPPVTGQGGSGTVFVTGCNLGCAFCQNYQLSREGMGRAVTDGEFAAICLALQKQGAENINLVTGSHAVPALVRCVAAARQRGLALPVLWNSSAYESAETLALLRDTADGYLPDLKTLDRDIAARYFRAPDYPETAAAAILQMAEHRPGAVLVRHLVLPGHLEATRETLRWFAGHVRGRAQLSLMTQFTPVKAGTAAIPHRGVSQSEYDTVLGWLGEFGIDDGFCQELAAGSDWLPDFDRANPFPSKLSVPVWHWRDGFIG
jgi:putative pyruvate formate lyase activating enzyme